MFTKRSLEVKLELSGGEASAASPAGVNQLPTRAPAEKLTAGGRELFHSHAVEEVNELVEINRLGDVLVAAGGERFGVEVC